MTRRKEDQAIEPVEQTVPVEASIEQAEDTTEQEAPVEQPEETEEETVPVEQAKAVKKPASTPAQRVTDALTKVARNLLACNPSLKVVYMTADGSGFRTRNDAENHARNLKNKAVTPVNR